MPDVATQHGATDVALLVEHARKDYGKGAVGRPHAVEDVSLSVSVGAIHGLLGPNGAGKTTTLKMLLGLVRPTSGRFEVLGTDAHAPGARRRLGFLPEQPYFPTQLTATEVLRLYGRLAGLDKALIAADSARLLERVGLEGKDKQPISKFSRGMLQRLGLAQALMGSPAVVVLDEPASGLDPVGQRDVRQLMLELREAGTTVLLSSHQLSEVEAICDEVTILNRGTVAAKGRIGDLLNVGGQSVVTIVADTMPPALEPFALSSSVSHDGLHVVVADTDVRKVVDAVFDNGLSLVSVVAHRDSLEDYFARMMETPVDGGEA